jgi:hypothetical protein
VVRRLKTNPVRVVGHDAKEMSVRDDRNVWLLVSRVWFHKREEESIVPSGTGRFFWTPTQHFVLGYFHRVPPGRLSRSTSLPPYGLSSQGPSYLHARPFRINLTLRLSPKIARVRSPWGLRLRTGDGSNECRLESFAASRSYRRPRLPRRRRGVSHRQ